MKYRILLDGDRCYPQKKGLLFWKCYQSLIKHPYGNNYIKDASFFSFREALEFLEYEGVDINNKPINIKRGDIFNSKLIEHAPTIGALTIMLFILMFIVILKSTGII